MKNLFYLVALILLVSCRQQPTIEEQVTDAGYESRYIGKTITETQSIYLQFANERLVNGKYLIDVLAKTDSTNKQLFGMNIRFFYDAADFTNIITLKNFSGGYGLYVWDQPKVYTGNAASKIMFNSTGAIRFVNGNMQLVDKSKPPVLLDDWAKLFEIEFTTVNVVTDLTKFCPELIWDKMPDPLAGSYLARSDGVTCTILAVPGSVYETEPVIERPYYYNWVWTELIKFRYPYGAPKCN